ncbi:amino acid/amide ABC transporter substrate-binding protein, HAAT family [Paracoccus aminovorans]|uniref:Amino acid/amide ABC transporter substrate-binding protein, HAAT family n=1 Tax=Paracoccus aminovorans TaxID=34004 RepID=A0A1I2ZPR5_9RHOB|nr:transporter substrate-binding domain-containing protein [Paracoccus aminovorans]CQR84153.1 amino acid ABC substrate-binding protein [Paracoccus aminovorans]SFH39837.1 amino acid/amide ABC transporter substrate-binding protein, HAAT family [Paracoccus aminovorans]
MKSDQPIYIGVLFSRSGWTAVTERSMLSATKFAIEEINKAGGIDGRELVPVYRDPMGDPTAYQQLAAELLTESKVKVILGCYTSRQRKAVLNVLDKEAGLLCYPAQYEGFEYSENIIYFGAVPNQNSLFLALYLLENFSPRLYIVGSDYVWPRESGRIMGDLIASGGGEILGQCYLGDDATSKEFDALMADIKRCSPDIIFNNFVGHSNLQFYNALAENGLDGGHIAVASLTTSETDIREIGAGATAGHITAATYFASQPNAANKACLQRYTAMRGEPPDANMCWDAAYTQAHVVAQAMRSCDPDNINSIRSEVLGASFDAPQGRITIDPLNAHCHVWPKIGIARKDGQFDIVAETRHAVRPDPYRTTYSLLSDSALPPEANPPDFDWPDDLRARR